MHDVKKLRENFLQFIEILSGRGLPENFSEWPKLDEGIRKLQQEVEGIKARKNSLSPEIVRLKKEGKDAGEFIAELRNSGQREAECDAELRKLQEKRKSIELVIPNIPEEDVPLGGEENNRVEKVWGEVCEFDFQPKPHWEIGEALGILDFERAAKLSGSRFAVLCGFGAKLERALASFMLDEHVDRGYVEISPPYMVKRSAMVGTGQLPKFAEDAFRTESSEDSDAYYLIPTAEVALCNLHAGEILSARELPKYYVAWTPCFRAEAGSYGKDVRGLVRLHQFSKVELVKITDAETSREEHESLVSDAENILEKLGLSYRRVILAAEDMGISAAKTYDLEVWLPSQGTYREISSCSNTLDWQSRRMGTRYRPTNESKTQFVHMLNGSGLAVGRTLLALLEQYQQRDGKILIPEVLRPYMGNLEFLE